METVFDYGITREEMLIIFDYEFTKEEHLKQLSEDQACHALYYLFLNRKDEKKAKEFLNRIKDPQRKMSIQRPL